MSSISSGNFNAMPFNNNGVNTQFNNNQLSKDQPPAGMLRKAQAEEEDKQGDTFTPMATPTDKSVFPMASTFVGGGAGLFVGGVGSAFVPKNQPTELKAKEGKGVTIEDGVVKHNGYTYTMEKVDGKYGVKYRPTVDITGMPYEVLHMPGTVEKFSVLKFNGQHEVNGSALPKPFIDGLGLKEGHEYSLYVGQDIVFMRNKSDKNHPKLDFDIVKDADGKSSLKISETLQKMIDDNDKFPDITKKKMEAIRDSQLAKNFKIFEANEKLPNLKSPEAIENLIHGAGRNWLGIAAITGTAIATGAGIGYLVGNKKSQPQPEPPVMG